jgi:uncharacterized protein (TIGR04222 family)
MPGPQFLQLYAAIIVATLLGAWLILKQSDRSGDAPRLPIPRNPDPYEIACLRGGFREVAWLAIFSLAGKGYVDTLEDGWQSRRVHPDVKLLPEAEREVFRWLQEKRKPSDMAGANLEQLKRLCSEYEARFQSMGLLRVHDQFPMLVAIVGIVLIGGLGAFKLLAALAKGRHNVGGLIAFGILGAIGVLFVCAFRPRLSAHGKRYLQDWQQSFEGLKTEVGKADHAMVNPAALLAVGVFGVAVLSASPYQEFRRLYAGPDSSGSSSSGCSSSDSSCGGGGDGGGGCGGCS